MARSIYSEKLKNRTNRLKLPAKRKPYKVLIAPGIFLCYRRNAGRLVEGDARRDAPGTWSVEAGWLKRFATADDYEDANGTSVMTYHQATARALKLARGSEGDSDKPVTVGETIDAYETDLAARGGAKYNATSLRKHVPPAMLAKVVMLLTETELRDWRNGLIAKGLKLSSANRIGKSFKAALALAAKRDRKRVTNTAAWREGLKPLKGKGGTLPPRDNYYLPDGTILAIVRECYVEDTDFGALLDVLAGTGVRESQALKLMPGDILDDDSEAPRLMMWCSNKGAADRDPEQRAIPITPKLAEMLRARAIARAGRGVRCSTGSGISRSASASCWSGSTST
ncbi:integrase [Bradyrhizobium sp. LB1.3]